MIATIQKEDEVYTAHYERYFHHPVEKVWSMLTDNEQLQQWFTELEVVDLRKDGLIKFDMQDGTFIDLKILDFDLLNVLAFEWGKDVARFKLSPHLEGCQLVFIETLSSFTEQTIKDLAGWHVCFDVIKAILDGRTIESRNDSWKSWYVKYEELLEPFMK
ncbi:activator of Hsp90 ATPase 1 family protein [Psychrobacillus glaciei]|uniref:Activator of Hsp90 ATPase 1 family protein n=1 Tax=Psychrobacillus glaciei TaxID=2283160 RepID=A0A5J6SSI1_9BACI|nr:SRPBCC family protein [Psychrobacillus glaciei]QFG00947.1 activator of Hsp90 ATPase 1 family protein [Psychrobacillus glaciei]